MHRHLIAALAAACLLVPAIASAAPYTIEITAFRPHAKITSTVTGADLCGTSAFASLPQTCDLTNGVRYKIHRWKRDWSGGTREEFVFRATTNAPPNTGTYVPDGDATHPHEKVTSLSTGEGLCGTSAFTSLPRECRLTRGTRYKIHLWKAGWSSGIRGEFLFPEEFP